MTSTSTKMPPGITSKMIAAAQALLIAMATEQAFRPVVEKYRSEILQRHQFRPSAEYADLHAGDEVILNPNLVYLLTEEDRRTYFAECLAARRAAGHELDHPDKCPLSVAESARLLAETALLDAMAEHPRLREFGELSTASLALRNQAVDLTLRLLAPYVGTGDSILREAIAG